MSWYGPRVIPVCDHTPVSGPETQDDTSCPEGWRAWDRNYETLQEMDLMTPSLLVLRGRGKFQEGSMKK